MSRGGEILELWSRLGSCSRFLRVGSCTECSAKNYSAKMTTPPNQSAANVRPTWTLSEMIPAQSRQMGTEPTAVLPLVGQTGVFNVLLCILVIVPISIRAADYVEITIELNSTWRSQTTTNHHGTTARCIVGSNDWHISGDFLRNAKVDYWLVGTNVIEHRIITSSMYIEQAKDFVSEKILGQKPRLMAGSYPRAGETFTTIHPSPIGQPAFHGMEGVVWLASVLETI